MSAFRSTLLGGSGRRYGVEMAAVTASLDAQLAPRWNLSGAVGAVTGGWLTDGAERIGVGSGGVASLGVTRTLVDNEGAVPFVMLSGALAASASASQAGRYLGVDFRAALVSGWTLWERFTPYATARVFGGPVFWRGEVLGDQWHFQLGAGFVLGLPGGFDLTAELIPLGEQRVSVGLGHTF